MHAHNLPSESEQQASTIMPPPTSALAAAILPFAIAQDLNIPCAYERSIKISPAGILTNRFLLSIDTSELNLDQAKVACTRLGMPAQCQSALGRRYHRASQFMLGFEERPDDSIMKVYLEMRGWRRPATLSHIGWKWGVEETTIARRPRTTLYRRIHCANTHELLQFVQRSSGSTTSPSLRLVRELLLQAGPATAELTCLAVLEDGFCRGGDLNLYPLQMKVESLSQSLSQMMAEFGLNSAQFATVMALCGPQPLGHLSVGAEYLTIYYLPAIPSAR